MSAVGTKSRVKEDKPRAIPRQLRDAHRQMKRTALATWRAWADAIAAGRDELPDPIKLLSVGTLLGIPAPADALASDAEAIREVTKAEHAIESCNRDALELATPWGGDRRKLVAAAEAAEAEGRRLREILARVDDNCNSGFWRLVAGQIRNSNPRAFVEFEDRIISQGEDLIDD